MPTWLSSEGAAPAAPGRPDRTGGRAPPDRFLPCHPVPALPSGPIPARSAPAGALIRLPRRDPPSALPTGQMPADCRFAAPHPRQFPPILGSCCLTAASWQFPKSQQFPPAGDWGRRPRIFPGPGSPSPKHPPHLAKLLAVSQRRGLFFTTISAINGR